MSFGLGLTHFVIKFWNAKMSSFKDETLIRPKPPHRRDNFRGLQRDGSIDRRRIRVELLESSRRPLGQLVRGIIVGSARIWGNSVLALPLGITRQSDRPPPLLGPYSIGSSLHWTRWRDKWRAVARSSSFFLYNFFEFTTLDGVKINLVFVIHCSWNTRFDVFVITALAGISIGNAAWNFEVIGAPRPPRYPARTPTADIIFHGRQSSRSRRVSHFHPVLVTDVGINAR